jgi:hypothetical protein
LAAPGKKFVAKTSANSVVYETPGNEFPCATEQGINSATTGIEFAPTGNKSATSGNWPKSVFARRLERFHHCRSRESGFRGDDTDVSEGLSGPAEKSNDLGAVRGAKAGARLWTRSLTALVPLGGWPEK